jgi:hypothetical protein
MEENQEAKLTKIEDDIKKVMEERGQKQEEELKKIEEELKVDAKK